MTFGSSSKKSSSSQKLPTVPFSARLPDSSVLLAGLMGLRPQTNPALTSNFSYGTNAVSGIGLGRRPGLGKRVMLGGL